MGAIKALTSLVGLHALTRDGVLGVYGEDKSFIPDPELTQALLPPIRQLLASYLANAGETKFRLGIIYCTTERRPWGADTFVLEKSVVQEVYPVSGRSMRELTAFQKKNQEKSIYRGMELLIEYRYDNLPDEPVYCPLLYDGGTLLNEYPPESGFGGAAAGRVPVIEVLNLMPAIPPGRRNTPEIAKLMRRMHRSVIRKDMRRGGFTLTNDAYRAKAGDGPARVDFFDVDKRHVREDTLKEGIEQRLLSAERTQQADRFDQVEKWLERPRRPVDAALLRTFAQFRDLDDDRLALLADKALVYTAPGGTRLLNIGMKDSWNMYLLEGSVSLQAEDGGTLTVTGGSDKAASPISFLKPRKYTVIALTSVSFLWIHDALLEAVLDSPSPKRITPALKPSRP